MLRSIALEGAPSYPAGPTEVGPLGPINFFFGGNGAGKSTLGRAMHDPHRYPGTACSWDGDAPNTVLIYNRDYQRTHFVGSADLPGVFLLGEESVSLRAEIEVKREERQREVDRRGYLTSTLTDKERQVDAATQTLREQAWDTREAVPAALQPMFAGYRSDKQKHLQRVLDTPAVGPGVPDDFDSLAKEAATVFDAGARLEATVASFAWVPFDEDDRILLRTPVVGSSDVDLAPLIERLGHADWVREGARHLEGADGRCPFCQQPAPADLEVRLAALFDERYEARTAALRALRVAHDEAAADARGRLSAIAERLGTHHDPAVVALAVKDLTDGIDRDARLLAAKLDQPSLVVEAVDPEEALATLQRLVDSANTAVAAHNALVTGRTAARRRLVDTAWLVFAGRVLAPARTAHVRTTTPLLRACTSLRDRIRTSDAAIADLDTQLRALRRRTVSSEPVIERMNTMLRGVGFDSFSIAPSEEVRDGYSVRRADGSRADLDTLSEGERTFITFLYFCQQLDDTSRADWTEHLTVVIDDPVSSLDSDILFAVSTLVRALMRQVTTGSGRARQLVVLTHNSHFHTEVTYTGRDGAGDRSYFRVRRSGPTGSTVEGPMSTNPVRSRYRALWDEVVRATRDADTSSVGLQNVMRRILENYFTTVGGRLDADGILDSFTGVERITCRSLLSWVNEGSHAIFDEFDHSPSELAVRAQLRVFEQIFERSGHRPHYDMMMAVERDPASAA